MFKSYTPILIAIFALGCNDDKQADAVSSEAATTEAHNALLGFWQSGDASTTQTLLEISDSSVSYYLFDPVYQCYAVSAAELVSLTNDSLTTTRDGQAYTSQYSLSHDNLSLSEGDFTEVYQPYSGSEITSQNLCSNDDLLGVIQADITFINLPKSIEVNALSSNDGVAEFVIEVTFDINLSGERDEGDIELSAQHFKWPNSAPSTLRLSDLPANLGVYTSSSNAIYSSAAQLRVQGDRVLLAVPRSQHVALESITLATPVFVSASYNYDNQYSSDRYPSSGFTSGEDLSLLIDPEGDHTGNASFIDFSSVEISIDN